MTAYEFACRVSLGMNELVAAVTQELKVLRLQSKFGEDRPDRDVVDFMQFSAAIPSFAASLANSSISRPNALTHALPSKAGEELFMLWGDSTLPARVRGTAVCVISATRRTKASAGIGRRDALGFAAVFADQINLPALRN